MYRFYEYTIVFKKHMAFRDKLEEIKYLEAIIESYKKFENGESTNEMLEKLNDVEKIYKGKYLVYGTSDFLKDDFIEKEFRAKMRKLEDLFDGSRKKN